MTESYPRIEFEAELSGHGTITIPPGIRSRLEATRKVVVRLTPGSIPNSLRTRGISEEEIEQISLTQLEVRDRVVCFLQSEGALAANKAFRRRASALQRTKR